MLASLATAGSSASTAIACPDEPIRLQASGPILETFFKALYSNDPYRLLRPENIVGVAKLAFQYNCTELQGATTATANRFAKKAKLSGGPSPTLPELLLLGQETKNSSILDVVLTKGVASFCTLPAAARARGCIIHVGQPLPCVYKTASCSIKTPCVDDACASTLAKLNQETLVDIIESLVTSLNGARPRAGARAY